MKHIAGIVALLTFVVAAIAVLGRRGSSPSVIPPEPETHAEPVASRAVRARTDEVARERIDSPTAAAIPSAAPVTRIVRLRVVDAERRGVADAVIAIAHGMSWPRGEGAAFRELHTDGEGRASATLESDRAWVRAHKNGAGRSSALYLHGSWVTER
jgi:hypothetical protein